MTNKLPIDPNYNIHELIISNENLIKLPKLINRFRKGFTLLEDNKNSNRSKDNMIVCRKGMIRAVTFQRKLMNSENLDESELKMHDFLFNPLKKIFNPKNHNDSNPKTNTPNVEIKSEPISDNEKKDTEIDIYKICILSGYNV